MKVDDNILSSGLSGCSQCSTEHITTVIKSSMTHIWWHVAVLPSDNFFSSSDFSYTHMDILGDFCCNLEKNYEVAVACVRAR